MKNDLTPQHKTNYFAGLLCCGKVPLTKQQLPALPFDNTQTARQRHKFNIVPILLVVVNYQIKG
ncbi:MAG: hypothetical protein ACOX1X_07915 [Dethiobacteria bacterium]